MATRRTGSSGWSRLPAATGIPRSSAIPPRAIKRGPTHQPIGMRGRPGDDLERARVRDVLEDPQRLR